MSVRRIAKVFVAKNIGQVVLILTQLTLPPAFLHAYGVKLYGEWLALSAAISYLSTFNYGLQTYATTRMTVHYNRGELTECRQVQSMGLRVLVSVFILAIILLLSIFYIPLDSILHISIPLRQAQLTLYILGCQIMANMLSGFFSGSYMVIREAHRGTHFTNFTQAAVVVFQLGLIASRASFAEIAGAQLTLTLLASLVMLLDLWKRAPAIRPSLRYWQTGALGQILKPSAQYALLYSSNILVYQIPLLLMQRLLGPAAVVVFSVTRTIYSMSRRVLNVVTSSLGPEITATVGQKDWRKLHRLYDLSERVILWLIPPITFGSMLATPLLLQLWLHEGNFYNPLVCLLLGITMSIMSIKQHKYQFQFSSNEIRDLSYMTIIAYGATVALTIPMMMKFGLAGYIATWGISEIVQLFYILNLNAKLLAIHGSLDRRPVYKLLGFVAVSCGVFSWLIFHVSEFSYAVQAVIAAGVAMLTLVVSYRVFGVGEIRSILWRKLSSRLSPFSSRRS